MERRIKRLTRTLSGVTPVAVMLKPYPCPHGKCIYCPSLNSPNSYTCASAPVRRAIECNYDPYLQVKRRLLAYEKMHHETSKIELIVMGGTFFSYPRDYRIWFVKRCFDAMNGVSSRSIEEAHLINERARHRCVVFTVETRPDLCKEREINELLYIGCTRVELGVQTLDEEVYKIVRRGHTLKDVIEATRLLKDSAYKVYYHFMPGLFSTPEKDKKMFKELFDNPDFRPDGLKIYPTLVVKGSELERWYYQGRYEPYDFETTVKLLAELKQMVPEYCRINRVMRAIARQHIVAGVTRSDLRNIVKSYMKEHGMECRCIRCREVGYRIREGVYPKKVELRRIDYKASKGKEVFLSFEDTENKVLIGLVRLRIPYKPFRKEITEDSALIRELHVYGIEVDIGKRAELDMQFQHKGYGRKLVEEAERIAREEFSCRKMVVIAGVGAREYFYKLGYRKEGPYVVKFL